MSKIFTAFLLLTLFSSAISLQCGHSESLSSGSFRIIGGTQAKALDFPWIAFIETIVVEKSTNKTLAITCTGSLIGEQWLVTAAHCLELDDKLYTKSGSRRILLGAHNASMKETAQVEVTPKVVRIMMQLI